MTGPELDIALEQLGLKVPEAERMDIFKALKFIEEMRILIRKPRFRAVEPANTVSFPKVNDDF